MTVWRSAISTWKDGVTLGWLTLSEDDARCNKSCLCGNTSTPAHVCANRQTWHLFTSPALSLFCKALVKKQDPITKPTDADIKYYV